MANAEQVHIDDKDVQIPMYNPDDPDQKLDFAYMSNNDQSIKLGEIRSKSQTPGGSQKVLELHYLGSKKILEGFLSPPQEPIDKQINFDLISLPDDKELKGSWRLIMNTESPLFSKRDLMKKEFKSERKVDFIESNAENKIQNYDAENLGNDPMRLKLIAVEDQNIAQGKMSMVFHMENEKGEKIQITNETQNEFFNRIYDSIIDQNNNSVKPGTKELTIGYDPKEAMVLLNQSFKFETNSFKIESLPESQKNIMLRKNTAFSGPYRKQKTFLPGFTRKGTKRGYNRRSLRTGSMSLRSQSLIESKLKERQFSIQAKDGNNKDIEAIIQEEKEKKKKLELNQTEKHEEDKEVLKNEVIEEGDEGKEEEINEVEDEDEDENDEFGMYSDNESERKNSEYSNQIKTETESELEDSKEKDIQVRMEIEVKKELWISLRMGPVLSYADQIRENLDDMGFEIKFIEDMEKIQTEKENLLYKNEKLEKEELKRRATLPKPRTSIMKRFQTQNSKIFENSGSFNFKGLTGKTEQILEDNWGVDERNIYIKHFDINQESNNGVVSTVTFKEADLEEDETEKKKAGKR
jgi:hypothetical protein